MNIAKFSKAIEGLQGIVLANMSMPEIWSYVLFQVGEYDESSFQKKMEVGVLFLIIDCCARS